MSQKLNGTQALVQFSVVKRNPGISIVQLPKDIYSDLCLDSLTLIDIYSDLCLDSLTLIDISSY